MQTSTLDGMIWSVAGAKAKLLEVMERAQLAPRTVTCNGKSSVVVVSAEEWHRKPARKGTLAEILLEPPLGDAHVVIERQRDEPGNRAL